MARIGMTLAAVALLATGCSAGAGPGVDDPQPATPEAKYVDKAHDVAPGTKDLTDSQVVRIGRTFCSQASLLTMDRPTTAYYIHGVSDQTKGPHYTSPREVRDLIVASAVLCPAKIRPAMRYLGD